MAASCSAISRRASCNCRCDVSCCVREYLAFVGDRLAFLFQGLLTVLQSPSADAVVGQRGVGLAAGFRQQLVLPFVAVGVFLQSQ